MSDPINDGGSAFPVPMFTRQADGQPMSAGEFFQGGDGMSLRDWFAGKSLSLLAGGCGHIFTESLTRPNHQTDEETAAYSMKRAKALAESAYYIADSMLAARTKGGQDE